MYISEYEDIFSKIECEELISFRDEKISDYSDFVIWKDKDSSTELSSKIDKLEALMSPVIEKYFSSFGSLITADDVALSGIGIIRQPIGAYDSIHFDTQVIVNKNNVKQRPFVCLLYLNDSTFKGGQLCFPIQKKVVEPQAGKVVIFPASYQFPHQVMGISQGDRYFLRFNYMFNDSLFDKDIDHWNIEEDGVMKFD